MVEIKVDAEFMADMSPNRSMLVDDDDCLVICEGERLRLFGANAETRLIFTRSENRSAVQIEGFISLLCITYYVLNVWTCIR